MTLAAGYIRYSSSKQEGNNSVEIQRREMLNAANRNEHQLPNQFIFIDRKVSAYRTKAENRSALNDLKETVKNNKDIMFIYFYDYSRLDRTIFSFVEDFYFDLKQYRPDVKILLCTTGTVFDPEDPRTKLEFIIANFESDKKARLISESQKNALEKQLRPAASTPYGYTMIEKTLYPNNNAPIVAWIFFLYSWGFSMNKIAQILNTDKVPPPRGTQWRTNTIEQILFNTIYQGKLTWNFTSRFNLQFEWEDVHDPIIPDFLYKMTELNKALKIKLERFDTPFLLLNIAYCFHCGQPLSSRNSSTKRNGKTYGYRYYQCMNCDYSIDITNLHEYILIELATHLTNDLEQIKSAVLMYIANFTQSIQEAIRIKQDDKKRMQINMDFIEEKPEGLPIEVKKIVQQALDCITYEISELEKDLKRIKSFFNEEQLELFFNQFSGIDVSALLRSEQRFILSLFIESISITNQGEYQLFFKKHPFD
ncbi:MULTISPECIES: recombinase family protein [Bacillus]|uniref:recombinase family protein n=1 Tax=Bacillus TaxID=1386 RepID=UPI0003102479|nr:MULTISPECIES: recombinase family protein [Bacillus]